MLRRRSEDADSVETERAALREQWAAVDALKRELTERVRAVERREHELQAGRQGAGTGREKEARPVGAGPTRAAPTDLERREASIAARERQLAQRERELVEQAGHVASPDEQRLAQIEARLSDLKNAEKMFLRTQQELSARSEALAARERMVGQRERELDQREDVADAHPEVAELEARLRKLEQRQATAPPQPALDDTQGFSGGFRKLQEQGTRRPPT